MSFLSSDRLAIAAGHFNLPSYQAVFAADLSIPLQAQTNMLQAIQPMQNNVLELAKKVHELYQQFIQAFESKESTQRVNKLALAKELFLASSPSLRAKVLQV